ncbi:adenylate cyclase type 10-like isoform X2 [Carlito syrichta]|uniref:Adenylate cyclase type 10-like isoform X2 n=1 Tax=Carlito syrichta TaxID=1868482 RepID=A0A1U7UCL0_CARSF|nr:adenylate cyclase type 10-like isoform X2 [Carlito syrichta]
MEGQVLHLQKQIEQQFEIAQDSGVALLKNLESLVAQNTTGPVFYPRLYHLMAYEWWRSSFKLTENQWLQTISSLPLWEKVVSGKVNIQDVQKNKFQMRVNTLDNPS